QRGGRAGRLLGRGLDRGGPALTAALETRGGRADPSRCEPGAGPPPAARECEERVATVDFEVASPLSHVCSSAAAVPPAPLRPPTVPGWEHGLQPCEDACPLPGAVHGS